MLKQVFNHVVHSKVWYRQCYFFLSFSKLETQWVSPLIWVITLGFLSTIIFAKNKFRFICKNQASVIASIFSKPNFPSKNVEYLEFFASSLSTERLHSWLLNSDLYLAAFYSSKYRENDFQQIFTIVLEARLLPACNEDWKIFWDYPSRLFNLEPQTFRLFCHI